MIIQHLGHADFTVEHNDFRLLIDPWFYPAFLESWFPYPDNRKMLSEAYGDAIYISHHHEDHFDRRFLTHVDKCTPILIADFRSRYLKKELQKLGFKDIRVFKHGEMRTLGGGFAVTILMDKSHKEDSAIFVQTDDGNFLDSNDCELAASDWAADVDTLAAQFSGAFWYPDCYDYDDETKARKALEVQQDNLNRCINRVRMTGAKAYIPSAGPAVFLDPHLTKHNESGAFPRWIDVQGRFLEACPGVSILPSYTDLRTVKDMAHEHRAEWAAYYDRADEPVTDEELRGHFEKLCRNNSRFLGDWSKGVRVYHSADRTGWDIPLGIVAHELEEAPEPTYMMQVPNRVLRGLVDGNFGWEEALHSMRVGLRRRPDVYDSKLMTLLQFGQRPAQTEAIVRAQQSDEVITRQGYTFQRWCPHAREDLTCALIGPDSSGSPTIECPRHHWKWNLATGECTNKGDIPLKTRSTL